MKKFYLVERYVTRMLIPIYKTILKKTGSAHMNENCYIYHQAHFVNSINNLCVATSSSFQMKIVRAIFI